MSESRGFGNSRSSGCRGSNISSASRAPDEDGVGSRRPSVWPRIASARAAIAACPSLWQEPLGKVVIEALAAGCAVLTTRRGGIPEVAEGRALIIDKPSVATFRNGFAQLLRDDPFRHQLQSTAFEDFPFTNTAMANKVDALRQAACDTARHRHRG